jgi:hypothetical protein
VIKLTDEMRAAVKSRMGIADGDDLDPWMGPAIEDVLAIVDRDRELQISRAYVRGWEDCVAKGAANAAALAAARPTPAPARCADCGRTGRNLVAVPDGGGTVLLGPTCKRRRLDAGQVRQALPIGGER